MFNNNFAKFTLTALAAFAISACGSSGGGSDDNGSAPANDQAQNQQTNQPSQPSTNNQTQRPTQPSQPQVTGGTGGALVISGESVANVRTAVLNGYNANSINVEGTQVTIGYPGIVSRNGFTNIRANGSHLVVCCGAYSDARFGGVASLSGNEPDYLFYNGNPTSNMPTSGSASYSGRTMLSAAALPSSENHHTGTSRFNVDFGNKTLNGSLNVDGAQPVNINATVAGNSFAGTTNSATLSAGRVEGKFYGDAAKELAGVAKGNDNSWGAAFGAQKQ